MQLVSVITSSNIFERLVSVSCKRLSGYEHPSGILRSLVFRSNKGRDSLSNCLLRVASLPRSFHHSTKHTIISLLFVNLSPDMF